MEAFISGSLSGFAQILVGHPFDTYKVWSQTNQRNQKITNSYYGVKYPILVNCVHNSLLFGVNHNLTYYTSNQWITGFITGVASSFVCSPMELYKIRQQSYLPPPKITELGKGFYATLIRESVAGSLYFGSYEILRHKLEFSCFFSGGIAGIISWLVTHPIDSIKSRIQNSQCDSILDGFKQGNIWKGIKFTIIRAFLVNSIGFYVFEFSQRQLNSY